MENSTTSTQAQAIATSALPRFISGTRSSNPYVKICGITNPADAEAAIEFGADALGFNVFPGSRRYINVKSVREWIEVLPDNVARVLIDVNPSLEQAHEWLLERTFHAVQLHGETWRPFAARLVETQKPLIAAVSVKDETSVAGLDWFNGFAFLFDGYRAGDFGGTGESFSWDLLLKNPTHKPVILAGGLTPENVAAAIRAVDPYAVDVASGVEEKPAKKDRHKLRDFIAAARSAADSR